MALTPRAAAGDGGAAAARAAPPAEVESVGAAREEAEDGHRHQAGGHHGQEHVGIALEPPAVTDLRVPGGGRDDIAPSAGPPVCHGAPSPGALASPGGRCAVVLHTLSGHTIYVGSGTTEIREPQQEQDSLML